MIAKANGTNLKNLNKNDKTSNSEINIIELSKIKSTGKKQSEFSCNKTGLAKKSVKQNLSSVDYAEFDFRANKKSPSKEKVKSEAIKVEEHKISNPKKAETSKVDANQKEQPAKKSSTKQPEKTQSKVDYIDITSEISKLFNLSDSDLTLDAEEYEEILKLIEESFETDVEEKALDVKTKSENAKKAEKTSKTAKKCENTSIEKDNSSVVSLAIKNNDENGRQSTVALACDRICYDESALRIINIARIGLLFD